MTHQEFRAIWKRTGLTLSQLAARLGISSGDTVRNWASGKRPVSGPAAILMRMIDGDDQEARDELVADLRDIADMAVSENGDQRWLQFVDRTMTAAIARIEKGVRWW